MRLDNFAVQLVAWVAFIGVIGWLLWTAGETGCNQDCEQGDKCDCERECNGD